MPVMSGFRVGLGNGIVNSRYSATALARADYLTAVAAGNDAYWVGGCPDHTTAAGSPALALAAQSNS
jgi:hypothetical protein